MSLSKRQPDVPEMGPNYRVGEGCKISRCVDCFWVYRVTEQVMIKPLNGGDSIIIKKEVIKGCEKRDGRVFNYTTEIHQEILDHLGMSDTGVAKIDAKLFFEKMGDPIGYDAEKSYRKFVRYFNGKHFPMTVDYEEDSKRFKFRAT